jgi:type II secretory pathway component PulF
VVLSLRQEKIFGQDVESLLNRVRTKDLVIFTRQLATLVDADVPFVDSLTTLADQTENPAFRKMLNQITQEVEAGSSFSRALTSHKRVFSDFFISLVRSGEASGKLHDVLLYLADHLERNQELKSKTKGALAYPIFVLVALVGVTIFLMSTVVPQLLSILKDAGVEELPITTRILLAVSTFMQQYVWLVVVGFLALIGGAVYGIRTPAGRAGFDRVLLAIPTIGGVARQLYIARVAESLSTLIKSGVPILEAIEISSEIVGNAVYRDILLRAREAVSSGGTISSVFLNSEYIPPMVAQMLAIGEKTGKIDFMLQHMSKFYKTQAETTMQSLSTLLEPILVLIIGVGVAILVASILLPIYNLVGAG